MTIDRPMFPPRAMTAEILKFPYEACRRVHSRKPRRLKNGTPEQRAAAALVAQAPPADVVSLRGPAFDPNVPEVDRRTLRGSPLRHRCAVISLGATVVGKMHTAKLRGQPLTEIDPEIKKEWIEALRQAEDAMIDVAIGIEQAMYALELGQPVLNLADEHEH
jgi:hypothetical protein